MQVNREELLRKLESVSSGLATREIIAQSSCFVFRDGYVLTYNDEVAAMVELDLGFTGAVRAQTLMSLLGKRKDEDVELRLEGKEILIKGFGSARSGVRIEAEIELPFDSVETPDNWSELDPDFSEAVSRVAACAATDKSNFMLMCVHVHPEYLEACDNFQLIRYPMSTGTGDDCLIRATTLRAVVGLGMTEISVTDTWLHFRNDMLRVSCRRWNESENYEDFSDFLALEGSPTVLPKGLADAVGIAEIFSAENQTSKHVEIELRPGRLRMRGEGPGGWHEERRKVKYDGEPIKFSIAPNILIDITRSLNECSIAPGKLIFDSGKYRYVACLTMPGDSAVEVS